MENSIDQALQNLAEALKAEGALESDSSISFKNKVYGKGLLWAGKGYTKQLVLVDSPDRIFSSESIDLAKEKQISVNGVKVLDSEELGPSVTKSNLRQVGRLRGLIVDGNMQINQALFYDASSDRLGLGTDEPNGAFSVNEGGVEVMVGTREYTSGMIGTFASHDFEIVTDDTSRIKIGAGGDITLGNDTKSPIKVNVHGKLSVGVKNPDPNVDLHVNGSIKFNNNIHFKGSQPPQGGTYNEGDICWNSKPKQRGSIGWVCTQAGSPGIWCPFGEIR